MENFRIKHFLKKALRQSCLPWMRCDGFISSPPVWRLCDSVAAAELYIRNSTSSLPYAHSIIVPAMRTQWDSPTVNETFLGGDSDAPLPIT